MPSHEQHFEIPHRVVVSVALGLVWLPHATQVNLLDPFSLFAIVFFIAVTIVPFWYFTVLTVSENGIGLYRVNYLGWNDIAAASIVSVFGLRYLRIKRVKGFHWWVPLYFVGDGNLANVLLEHSPESSPIQEALIEDGI